MSDFSLAWLDLRETADRRARNSALAVRSLQWLEQGGDADLADSNAKESIVVDLGSGTGSTLRALASDCGSKILWRLVDNNSELLDVALQRHRSTHRIERYQADLAAMSQLPLNGARLVTASALFDLCSANVVGQLVERLCADRSHCFTALYTALIYDGRTEWTPVHPMDAAVLNAFNQDQLRDKGMGKALGPTATAYLQTVLEKQGFDVATADSSWLLGPDDRALVIELIRGMTAAVNTGYGLHNGQLDEWQTFRLAHAASGDCRVGHQDLLALPPMYTNNTVARR